jgi:hypothetical protein
MKERSPARSRQSRIEDNPEWPRGAPSGHLLRPSRQSWLVALG